MLLATELVQGFGQRNVSYRGVLKVDLRKAFDTVGWEFILKVLESADVPGEYTKWVK